MSTEDREPRTENLRRPSVLRSPSAVLCLLSAVLCLLSAGCAALSSPFRRPPPRPGRTTLGAPLVTLPAQSLGNCLIVEAKWDRGGPYHFLVDTGSSVTLVTPTLAKRYAAKDAPPPDAPRVRVASADGGFTELPATTIQRLDFGDLRFDDVPVLIYDCAPLTAHFGLKIDGVLGFPLFRETRLTLDYPRTRVIVQRANSTALTPGSTVPLDDASKTPLIRVRLGDRTLVALIDSGSDAPFSLNPVGIDPEFAVAPRAGATVSTLTGDRPQQVGRLAETLVLGRYELPRPIVELTDELSTIGGGILKNFTVTFDQQRDRVTFHRDSREPIPAPPRRSAGVSFTRTPAYWRVASVIPGSPADQARMEPGDLVTRVNGEHVAKWDLRRYDQLVATAREITCTLLYGSTEAPTTFATFELVP